MKTTLRLALGLAILWAVPDTVLAQVKYFGYFGSNYIGSDCGTGNNQSGDACGAETADHANIVMIDVGMSNWTTQMSNAASRGQKGFLNVSALFFNASTCAALSPSAWSNYSSTTATYVSNGTLLAFYHMDEPFANADRCGMSYTTMAANLHTVNSTIHGSFSSTPIAVVFSGREVVPGDSHEMVGGSSDNTTGAIPDGYDWSA